MKGSNVKICASLAWIKKVHTCLHASLMAWKFFFGINYLPLQFIQLHLFVSVVLFKLN